MTRPGTPLAAALVDRYRLERELGQGGMATVFLAEDLKHDRKVAIKVLKPELAVVLGAERFVQEIKTTAALTHPHILPLFDSGEAGGFLYYVMPYLQGETVRDKLSRETQCGVEEAIRLTTEVADALDHAHRHGVVHRDIKPENILLCDGRAMVMDFGIALAVSAAAGGRMTETGLSLGTPHYMSPEQATADKEISARSDIYSLASVLYEMLAGEPPHSGGSAQQVIMKIVTEEAAPVTRLRKAVPAHVAAAVAKALEKLPADRFDSARAFAEALRTEGFRYQGPGGSVGAGGAGAGQLMAGRRALMAVGAIAAIALVAAAWGWLRPVPEVPALVVDLALGLAEQAQVGDVAISPDGTMLAYAGRDDQRRTALYLRRLAGGPDFHQLPGTEGGVAPDFSPDSRWIVFHRSSDRALVKVAVGGGGVNTILEPVFASWTHWGTDDRIVYWGSGGCYLVSAAGGEPKLLKGLGGRRPFLLPDGSGVLGSTSQGVALYDLRTDSVRVLVPGGTNPVYAASGHLLYVGEGAGLFAVPFDLGTHRVTGPAVRVLDRVASQANSRGYAVSRTGVLVQHDAPGSGPLAAGNRMIIQDFAGGADTLKLARGSRWLPRFSPSGRFIAYIREAPGGERTDLVTFDRETGTETPITFTEDVGWPAWSPDGRRLAYSAVIPDSGQAIRIKASDNSGEAVEVVRSPGFLIPTGWPRDDLLLFSGVMDERGNQNLYTTAPTPGAEPQAYLAERGPEQYLTLSPDQQLAAFVTWEGALSEVWLREFPTPVGRWKVSSGGGSTPRWSPDGRFLYYWKRGAPIDTLMRARVDRAPSVRVYAPEQVVAREGVVGTGDWDLHPDGARFVVVENVRQSEAATTAAMARARFLLHLNWFSTLRARVSPAAP